MIAVIADDLTGAAELGGIGLRRGLNVEIVIRGECAGDADLLCVDTDSRACTAKEATQRAAAAANELRKAGARWIYKKVDSVLRGNVLPEIHAIQKTLGLRSTLLIPANPCFGRQIHDGRYYVNGKPIHRTAFAHDPDYPRTSSKVLEMLKARKAFAVTVNRLAEPLPASGIVLGEVSTSADVQEWARRRNGQMLVAGGAEFFGALLNVLNPTPKMSAPSTAVMGRKSSGIIRELFVCGSTSEYTRQFVSEADRNGIPVYSFLLSSSKHFSLSPLAVDCIAQEAILEFRSHPRVILEIGRPLLEKRTVARKLARYLAETAVLVIARAKPDHVYAEGGATAAELVRQLGWRRMKVLKELAPGVTTLSLPGRNAPLLTIKPGSYPGWPK
jgi:D-threonate/D-erythronate kinase